MAVATDSNRAGTRSRRSMTDQMLCELVRAGDRIGVALAKSSLEFVRQEGWMPFGYARVGDFTREELDRSGRWLRDLAALGTGLHSFPALERALLGLDGRPIGRVAATWISRIAVIESLQAWIDRARACSARELQDAIRAAREAGSHWPVPSEASGSASKENRHTVEEEMENERMFQVSMSVPRPVAVAFRETLELHRAVSGHQASIASFVAALCAESAGGPSTPDANVSEWASMKVRRALEAERAREEHFERQSRDHSREWKTADSLRTPVTEQVCAILERCDVLSHVAGQGDIPELARQLRELVALEDDIERSLGRLLHAMHAHRDCQRIGYASLGHCAEQIGMSRRTAERRAGILRALQKLPLVLAAYEAGELGLHAAWVVRQVLGAGPVQSNLERTWIARAREVTIKRLRDEARAQDLRSYGLLRDPAGTNASRAPLSDAAWQASLRRDPGMTLERVRHLGSLALDPTCDNVFLRLHLPHDVASELLTHIECARQRLIKQAKDAVPGWMGLFALLEDYCDTWDDPRAFPVREWDEIYRRDGWRCMTPGCTGRRRIEDHHIVYRSDQGSDAPENQVSLCRLHHHFGEHGLLARCRGNAPLGILWRLGAEALGRWFRNERRIDRPVMAKA